MDKKDKFEVKLHFLMAVCGGFIGGYAIFSHMSVFGSAQTANLIELVASILGHNFNEVGLRIGALLIYIGAIVCAVYLEKRTKLNLKYLCIGLELLAVLFVGMIPESVDPMLSLYPIFFVTAFQWCVFKGALGYASSTIFSTNNIKQTVISLTEYALMEDGKQRQEKLQKAQVFGGTLISFHTGVAFSYLACSLYGIHAIWLCSILLLVNLSFMIYEYEFKTDKYLVKEYNA